MIQKEQVHTASAILCMVYVPELECGGPRCSFYAGAQTSKRPATEAVEQPSVLSTTALCGNDPPEQSEPWYPMNAAEITTPLTSTSF